jgi:hypothetical protein
VLGVFGCRIVDITSDSANDGVREYSMIIDKTVHSFCAKQRSAALDKYLFR